MTCPLYPFRWLTQVNPKATELHEVHWKAESQQLEGCRVNVVKHSVQAWSINPYAQDDNLAINLAFMPMMHLTRSQLS